MPAPLAPPTALMVLFLMTMSDTETSVVFGMQPLPMPAAPRPPLIES